MSQTEPAESARAFQGLENFPAVFPGLGKNKAAPFHALEKFARGFPGLGKFSDGFSKGWQPKAACLAKLGWKTLALAAVLCASVADAGEARVVTTGQMELEFRDGWLTRWKNKLTDEEIRLGSGKPIPEAAAAEFLKADDSTAALTQAGASVWALRVPCDKATTFHAAVGPLRQRYVLIQAKSGGLLLLLDDPPNAFRAALERNDSRRESILTFRAAPATAAPAPTRWLIKQYLGKENWGAQHRLDYLLHTQTITPPDRRPTAWAQSIALVVADPPWCTPAAGVNWAKSLEIHHAWLDNLQRIADPDKLLFDVRDWRTVTGGVEPYVVLMASRVRRLGYHIMLRLNATASTANPHAAVGEIVAALRATTADAVLLEHLPDAEYPLFQLLRSELDQNGMAAVALGVTTEPAEAAVPLLDFCGGTDAALATLLRGSPPQTVLAPDLALRGQSPLPAKITLADLLTDEELQKFGLPPHPAGPVFTPLQLGTLALARFWSENQPRLLPPKFFEIADLARYRLLNDRVLRLIVVDANSLRLAYENGTILADLTAAGWTNQATLLEQYGPVFLKDKLAR